MVAWFICPYKRASNPMISYVRYCAMDDFTAQIRADGGKWAEVEVLGNRAIVKVNALPATLDAIAAAPNFVRIPTAILDDPLSTLTPAQRNAIINQLTDAGYTVAEVQAAFPNIANRTLREVLHFMASRKIIPRYDSGTDSLIFDGPVHVCTSTIEWVDANV